MPAFHGARKIMRATAVLVFAASLISGAAAFAQPGEGPRDPQGEQQQPPAAQPPPPGSQRQRPPSQRPPRQQRPDTFHRRPPEPPTPAPVVRQPGFRTDGQRWSRGDRLPAQHRQDQYEVQDWRQYNLSRPPRGYRWYCQRGGHCFLVAVRTGVIRDTRWRDDRERNWRDRYSRRYTYSDDIYYRECRNRADPAGILIGGLIGGLLGGAAHDADAGDVFAGIIIGGVLGGSLVRDMDCEDRSYAYYAYYHGLNSGRPGTYRWRNPRNNHRGDFRVRSYYDDPYGFHCANYSNTAWTPGRRIGSGRACRQPDGGWAFVN
jgi:Ni/Co efflux regulator RcnB/surface antigen